MMSTSVLRQNILLVEPSSMTGSIVVSTARQLGLPRVQQVNSVRNAQNQLGFYEYLGLIISLDEMGEALALLHDLRGAKYKGSAALPIAVIAHEINADLAAQLKALSVRRILLKPFKVRDLISTIEILAAEVALVSA